MTVVLIMLLTSTVYMGSSIFTPGIMQGVEYFGLGQVTVTLGLSLFVAGYGIGPLFLSPITEIPHVGRTIPYIVTLAIFCVLQVPTALVTNFAGFAILRFIAGFVGSPPLATGGEILLIFQAHGVIRLNRMVSLTFLQAHQLQTSLLPTKCPMRWDSGDCLQVPPLLSRLWSQDLRSRQTDGAGRSGRCCG